MPSNKKTSKAPKPRNFHAYSLRHHKSSRIDGKKERALASDFKGERRAERIREALLEFLKGPNAEKD